MLAAATHDDDNDDDDDDGNAADNNYVLCQLRLAPTDRRRHQCLITLFLRLAFGKGQRSDQCDSEIDVVSAS